jgi:hypothetical protein
VKKIQVGPGVAYRTAGVAFTNVYEENGRVFRADYDPRETGDSLVVETSCWTEPQGLPITEAERERIYDALWALGPGGNILEVVPPAFYVPVRWDRGPDGWLLDVAGEITYLELRHVFSPKSEQGYDFATERSVWTLDIPEHATWTVPAGEPMSPEHRARIVERLRGAAKKDLRIGTLGNTDVIVRTV